MWLFLYDLIQDLKLMLETSPLPAHFSAPRTTPVQSTPVVMGGSDGRLLQQQREV
jgi:hypothetical protein